MRTACNSLFSSAWGRSGSWLSGNALFEEAADCRRADLTQTHREADGLAVRLRAHRRCIMEARSAWRLSSADGAGRSPSHQSRHSPCHSGFCSSRYDRDIEEATQTGAELHEAHLGIIMSKSFILLQEQSESLCRRYQLLRNHLLTM